MVHVEASGLKKIAKRCASFGFKFDKKRLKAVFLKNTWLICD